jgi:hypothetical protein
MIHFQKKNDPKMNLFCGSGIRSRKNLHLMFKTIHTTGCKFAIHSFMDYKHNLTASISIGFLIPQFIGIILIIAFISILHFLIAIESDKNSMLFGQFKQSTYDVTNTSKFIKIKIGNEKIRFIKNMNLQEIKSNAYSKQVTRHITAKKASTGIYQIRTN